MRYLPFVLLLAAWPPLPILGLGLALGIGLEALAAWIQTREPRPLAYATARLMRRVNLAALVAVALAPRVPAPFLLTLVLTTLAGALVLYGRETRHLERPRGYGAFTYYNKDDERLFVPKQLGVGVTLNFAHPAAVPCMIVLILTVSALTAAVIR